MPILNASDLTRTTSNIREKGTADRTTFKTAQIEAIRGFANEIQANMEEQLAAHQARVMADTNPYTVDSLCDKYRDPNFFPCDGFTPSFTSRANISCIDEVVGRCNRVNSMDVDNVSAELMEMLKPTMVRAETLGFRTVFEISARNRDCVDVSVKLRAPATIRDLYGEKQLNDYDREFLARN